MPTPHGALVGREADVRGALSAPVEPIHEFLEQRCNATQRCAAAPTLGVRRPAWRRARRPGARSTRRLGGALAAPPPRHRGGPMRSDPRLRALPSKLASQDTGGQKNNLCCLPRFNA